MSEMDARLTRSPARSESQDSNQLHSALPSEVSFLLLLEIRSGRELVKVKASENFAEDNDSFERDAREVLKKTLSGVYEIKRVKHCASRVKDKIWSIFVSPKGVAYCALHKTNNEKFKISGWFSQLLRYTEGFSLREAIPEAKMPEHYNRAVNEFLIIPSTTWTPLIKTPVKKQRMNAKPQSASKPSVQLIAGKTLRAIMIIFALVLAFTFSLNYYMRMYPGVVEKALEVPEKEEEKVLGPQFDDRLTRLAENNILTVMSNDQLARVQQDIKPLVDSLVDKDPYEFKPISQTENFLRLARRKTIAVDQPVTTQPERVQPYIALSKRVEPPRQLPLVEPPKRLDIYPSFKKSKPAPFFGRDDPRKTINGQPLIVPKPKNQRYKFMPRKMAV